MRWLNIWLRQFAKFTAKKDFLKMNFKFVSTDIPGCYELLPQKMADIRGSFVKTFQRSVFIQNGLETDWREEYHSLSHKGVLRGMHFQLPPYDHVKIVYCPMGEVFDVVLDLRMDSPAFGQHVHFRLSDEKANIIYIPKGCAHGFYTVSDQAVMMYKVSTEYVSEVDTGILWNSFGASWSDNSPIMSERDKSFIHFSQFNSPFRINQ